MISKWGSSRAYKIMDVEFDKDPFTLVFMTVHDERMTLAEYLLKTY